MGINDKRLIVFQGLPASGKSTAAKEACDQMGHKRINFDLLREMLDFSQHTKENEKFVHTVAKAIAKLAFDSGKSVVMDNTNLSRNQQSLNSDIAKANRVEIDTKDMTFVSVEECIARDSKRGEKSVGEKVIRDMWNKYVRPPVNNVEYDPRLPDCIICDLDGTLAERVTDRNPYGGGRVYEDAVRQHVAEMIKALTNMDDDLKLLFVSGREGTDVCRKETDRYLVEKTPFVCYDGLFMRKEGDDRKDYIVKREIYEQNIKGKYNVAYIFEDRHQVAQEWDRLGLGDKLIRVGRVDADNF